MTSLKHYVTSQINNVISQDVKIVMRTVHQLAVELPSTEIIKFPSELNRLSIHVCILNIQDSFYANSLGKHTIETRLGLLLVEGVEHEEIYNSVFEKAKICTTPQILFATYKSLISDVMKIDFKVYASQFVCLVKQTWYSES
ncbi:hypothetical protein WN51_06734 [Melipona quadrifasciata]|uniref:Uncharacterized protein n=1 Tax=Melipona quadrifasciata TaxID=166423 RepID=A0A0M8ZSY3_9HYME|nr:hypothetical protein WN51_06734 [Melipona quadrifasciata]